MNDNLEHIADSIMHGMRDIATIEVVGDGVRFTTHCMYPSNGLVRVTVKGGRETVYASDEGEAVGEALSAGAVLRNPDKLLRGLLRPQGLDISNGIIRSDRMPLEAAPLAILAVSNAARDIAVWLYDHHRLKSSRDFRRMLSEFLKHKFDDQVSAATIVGKSNKPHKFANVISFPNGRRLIVDPVANDPSSINARVVAHLDVRSTNDPTIDQRIVYDDAEKWSPSDLNLLQVGANVIPFSKATDVIQRAAERVQVA
ncbi:hypothetical protein [Bradyrhizobium cosmicum]|uniref:hypothetical protein n=1 Tax=Bradyrhizobium cosmicum TaxID=1404864 RepID=UPI001163C470|nr:hypothetical protein [Bradyrhizobium cosmicum]QDP26930.1 hypothetical protein FNV92_34400 [Bradyrhizobium cosmicum]